MAEQNKLVKTVNRFCSSGWTGSRGWICIKENVEGELFR